jgi:hypothetical protein
MPLSLSVPPRHCFHIAAGSIALFFIKISGPRQREIERVF